MSTRRALSIWIIAIVLLSSAMPVLPADDPCFVAYWDNAKNDELAACENSAQTGDADSEFGYGLILFSGHDRTNDRASGLEWLRKSARQGHPLARGMLCSVLTRDQIGKGLTNPLEAYAWCSISGSAKRALKIKAGMTAVEAADARRMAADYLAKYGPNKPLVRGTEPIREASHL